MLQELYEARMNKNDSLIAQIAGGCIVASRDIFLEDAGTANHANRIVWANRVQANPRAMALEMLTELLNNAAVQAGLPTPEDNDIQYVVNSLINTYATGE